MSERRRRGVDLLVRPPVGDRGVDPGWSTVLVDSGAQLTELAELHRRGLLSLDEYQRQRNKVLRGA